MISFFHVTPPPLGRGRPFPRPGVSAACGRRPFDIHRPRPKALCVACGTLNSKSNSKFIEPPPNLPQASTCLCPDTFLLPLYDLFTRSSHPLCTLFAPLTHDTANFDSNLVHLDSHAPFLMPFCVSMLSACCHMMPTCPILAPSRLPKLQF